MIVDCFASKSFVVRMIIMMNKPMNSDKIPNISKIGANRKRINVCLQQMAAETRIIHVNNIYNEIKPM